MYADYLNEKSWLVSLAAMVIALVIAASVEDLLAGLAVAAAVFLFGYPVLSTHRAWNRRGDPERGVQVVISALPLAMAGWVVTSSVVDKGFAFTAESFEWVGGDVVVFLAFLFFVSFVPRWKQQRKVCPECCKVVKSKARVCAHCNFRWEAPLGAMIAADAEVEP